MQHFRLCFEKLGYKTIHPYSFTSHPINTTRIIRYFTWRDEDIKAINTRENERSGKVKLEKEHIHEVMEFHQQLQQRHHLRSIRIYFYKVNIWLE